MGGNVFKDAHGSVLTKRINKADVLPTVKWLETVTQLPLQDNMLGTTGKRSTSGDIDLAVDANYIDKDGLVAILAKHLERQKLPLKDNVRKSGISVHFKAPIDGNPENGFVQCDFMFGEPEWLKWSLTGAPEGSQYKGAHRHKLLSSLANSKGMKWSYQNGLLDRETNNIISKDPNEIAKKLLGQLTTAKDLLTVESILNVITKLPNYSDLVREARIALEKDGVELPEAPQLESFQTGTPGWFRNIISRVEK